MLDTFPPLNFVVVQICQTSQYLTTFLLFCGVIEVSWKTLALIDPCIKRHQGAWRRRWTSAETILCAAETHGRHGKRLLPSDRSVHFLARSNLQEEELREPK